MEYKKAVENLYYWQRGQHFFTAELYSLMAKADFINRRKLFHAFPIETQAFSDWYFSEDPDLFFKSVLGELPRVEERE